MRRLRILTWHVHGTYLRALARVEHDWFLAVSDGPDGYGGRQGMDLPDYVREVPANAVRDLDLDLVLYQSARNWEIDRHETLSPAQRALPSVYLEHNTPRAHPVDARHPVDDPNVLLVQVTHFNRLMWDSGRTPTTVIEHSVVVDPEVRYIGNLSRGISVVNEMARRKRIVGEDVFLRARERVPLDLAGIDSLRYGGLGDLPYPRLHREMAQRRLFFSPIRYTSLPLAVIEAMTIGLPIVALATTELATVVENGQSGFVSCDVDALVDRMRDLLADPAEAARMGTNARAVARERFGLDRFVRDWNAALADVVGMRELALAGVHA
jgi:glycosyltransferase involved in cell wall biosynthesis